MLHIVNGDTVGDKLKQGGIQGEVLVWLEIWSEGPVFVDASSESNRVYRANYLEQTMGIPSSKFIALSQEQERILEQFREHEEIVLWFEYDLFDQAMLCCLLHWFAGQPMEGTKLSLLSLNSFPGIDDFRGLGQLSVEQLLSLVGTWQPVGQKTLELGKQLWEAYASPDPLVLNKLLQEGDLAALPYAGDSFRLHLARFPSILNGLGIVEQTTLELVESGIHSPLALFKHTGDKLHGLGMGDLQYWYRLERMTQGSKPLLAFRDFDRFPDYMNPSISSFREGKLELTPFGKAVLAGKEDGVVANGIECWYGGVHLSGHRIHWRWDSSKQSIVRT